jgi:hypothetical protein
MWAGCAGQYPRVHDPGLSLRRFPKIPCGRAAPSLAHAKLTTKSLPALQGGADKSSQISEVSKIEHPRHREQQKTSGKNCCVTRRGGKHAFAPSSYSNTDPRQMLLCKIAAKRKLKRSFILCLPCRRDTEI